MVSVFSSSTVDCGVMVLEENTLTITPQSTVLEENTLTITPQSTVLEENTLTITPQSTADKNTAFRRKSKDWLVRNQNNVSERSDMSIRRLMFR
jgi:hypothetical protein